MITNIPAKTINYPNELFKSGGTPLIEVPEIAKYFNLSRLYIKDESANPFGTHKDRKSEYAIDMIDKMTPISRPDAFCILTSGNAGLSLVRFAQTRNIPVVALIDMNYISQEMLHMLEYKCEKVIHIDTDKGHWLSKELCHFAGETDDRHFLDMTNYADAYLELIDELAYSHPDTIFLPVGGGELFIGLHSRIQTLGLPTRLIGVTIQQPNSCADKLYARWTPYREQINRICAKGSTHRIVVLKNEDSLRTTHEFLTRHIICEPSSAAAFEALRIIGMKDSEKIIVINTGTWNKK